MNKNNTFSIVQKHIISLPYNQEFKLNDILGKNCPAYPGAWLYEWINEGSFDTPSYHIKWVRRDYSDTYVKVAI